MLLSNYKQDDSTDLSSDQLWNYKLVCLVLWQNVILVMSRRHIRRHSCYGNIFITSVVKEQSIPCSDNFSMTLQNDILLKESSDFLIQIISQVI